MPDLNKEYYKLLKSIAKHKPYIVEKPSGELKYLTYIGLIEFPTNPQSETRFYKLTQNGKDYIANRKIQTAKWLIPTIIGFATFLVAVVGLTFSILAFIASNTPTQ